MDTVTPVRYSFGTGLKKSIIAIVLFGVPVLMNWLPAEWMNLTVGAVLALLVNYIKVAWFKK